nr:uracil-DNA glycosylase [Clostridia bacterium]
MNWEDLELSCKNCTKCPLHETRTNCVFGTGSRTAKLMFVGEAPGEKEDLSGIPFVGAAGQLFDKFLCAVGIEREEVYIANMLKCRPPKNRDPLPGEQDLCIEYLREQVRLISPKLIVCLGRISAY